MERALPPLLQRWGNVITPQSVHRDPRGEPAGFSLARSRLVLSQFSPLVSQFDSHAVPTEESHKRRGSTSGRQAPRSFENEFPGCEPVARGNYSFWRLGSTVGLNAAATEFTCYALEWRATHVENFFVWKLQHFLNLKYIVSITQGKTNNKFIAILNNFLSSDIITTSSKGKESDVLLCEIWSLVMVRNQ